MSGPFRFDQPSAQSPLERVASPLSAGGQPVSYKANVNRAKTKKWVEAKKNTYDGDDWGDYDEYDEYGVDTTPPPEPAPPANQRYYGQRPPHDTPSRSFTDPSQQLPLPKARRNSFDAGEEQRSFSASVPHPQHAQHAQPPQPPPLQTRVSTAPTEVYGSPVNTQFPPRKSSIGQGSAPPEPIDFIPVASPPRDRTGSQDKPLPFIRPADIYKRVEEERRRESMESQSRPSLDSLSRPKDEPASPIAERRNLQPLATVAERKSEYLPDLNVTAQQQDNKPEPQRPQHDQVPTALAGIPTFDNDFWSSGPDMQSPASHAPVVSPTQDQGLRSVVDQAFTRSDDQRSVPPTPISKDSDSDLNRSNTGSTSGISPIMSRVPSSATAALKTRGLGDGSTPVIAEEPHEAGTPVSRPTSSSLAQTAPPFQGHARNVSGSSLPRSGLATPTRGDSPARSPAFGPQKTLPEPETAQIATDSSDSPDAMEGGLKGPQSAYATREADMAHATSGSPVRAGTELGAAQKQSQDAFLESHKAQSSISDALPRDRSESPSKGRVQALAGKFGEVSSSRRGSTQSNASRNSVQSWERSRENSRAPSPSKGSPSKPGSPKKEFRPHLPGGWDSYAITTPAPLDRRESEKGLGFEGAQSSSEPTQLSLTEHERGRGVEQDDNLAGVDLTPTTQRHQLAESEQPAHDPLSALKNAGAAMTESLRTSVGLGESTEDGQEQGRRSYGDVYVPRPLLTDRSESAVSSIPPTPPAKDTPTSEFPPTPPLKQHSPERLSAPDRPIMATQLSTDPSADDQESDRLRKEIVASLSPLRMSTVPSIDPDHNSLRPDSKGADRASSILDSYYAELEKDSPRTSNDLNRDIPELAPLKATSSAHSATPQKPAALNRFSWEANSPHLMTPEKQPQAAAVPEPTKGVDAEKISSPVIEKTVQDGQGQWNGGIPEDPYFGPSHTFTVTKPEPVTEADLAGRAPTPPLDTGASLTSPPTREQTRSPGLHIVNSAQDPEAVDLPPRWSAEHSNQSPHQAPTESPLPQEPKEQSETNPAVSANAALTGSIEAPESSAVHDPELKSPTSPRSPTTDKPLGAREIATIGSTAERIATYNKTREQWANTDHGLSSWISATFEADPSLATQSAQAPSQPRPQSMVFRHKHTASLAMLGKFTGSSNNQPSGGAYSESAGAQVPASSSSPTAGPSKTSTGFLGRTGSHSIQTQQMQAKGKDLLHSAGVLSGKGMTSAKGLFAKGKSRFNRDKDTAHSREAPSELEPVSIPIANTTPVPRSCTTADSPEPKKRRRFSSPFRRSRSRPRSASAALSSTTSLHSSTSLTALSTNVPDIPKAFQGRPHSYHAPDLGMHPAYRGSADQLISTPLSYEQGRSWVQPSQMRSGFVTETEVQDDSVPPVPPIPAGINHERRGRRSRSWGNASLMIQSAMQHAASPVKGSKSVGASPVVAQFNAPDEARDSRPRAYVADAYQRVPWNDTRDGNGESTRARYSSPTTNSLWMGAVSPTLSKRTATKVDEAEDKNPPVSVQPKVADGTLPPSDSVELPKHHGDITDDPAQDLPEKHNHNGMQSEPSTSANSIVEGSHDPWPGTLLANTKSREDVDEAPLPRAFVMQLPSESPLLHSAKASLHDVSEDEEDMSSLTSNHVTSGQIKQRLNWETEVVGAGDVSDEEDMRSTKNQLSTSVSRSGVGKENEPRSEAVMSANSVANPREHLAFLQTSRPGSSSSHTITRERLGQQANFETRIIGVGDVSPTSDHEDISAVERAPTPALDMQSALESRIVGDGDVSPVSTRSFDSISEATVGHRKPHDDELVGELARPIIDRFHTASMTLNVQPVEDGDSQPVIREDVEERPRIERFETAQQGVQGSSELIPRIRQPASRFATVMSSEPVVSYKEYSESSSSSRDNLLDVVPEASMASSALTPPRSELAPERADMPRRVVSASQLQVVHAVEEYAASNSSLASWDQDSNATDGISEPAAAVEMKDESDLITPVAHVPSHTAHHQQADQAADSNSTSSYAASNGYFHDQSTVASAQGQQHPVSSANMTVPERSKSLLSIISSAVSSVPISPASSNAGRSTPSTIHRMQRDLSNAKKTNLTDVRIPEEPTSAKDDRTPTAKNEDYDLYADHNGVVKDVHDDNGQPLRIVATPSAAPLDLARTTTGASSIGTVPDVHDSPGRRYSFERPMSFISGPQDDDGRPQDQINQPISGVTAVHPPRSNRRSQQYPRAPSGAIYSNFEPVQDMHWPPGEMAMQPPVQAAQPSVRETVPAAKVARQPTRFVPHVQEGEENDDADSAQQASSLPPQRAPPSIPPERPVAKSQPPSNHRQVDATPDSRLMQNPQVQPRSVSAPMQQMLAVGNDHRVVSQPLGSPPAASLAGPRNEFEYQQQMMQLQAKYPRFRGTENQALAQQPGPAHQNLKAQEKASSKPSLAQTLKGIVGRTSPNALAASNTPPPASTLAPVPDAVRAESFVSAVSNLSREPNTSSPGAQSGVSTGPQRPPSLGADSQYSHLSHGSTQVQPAQSRQSLTMPGIPAQYQNSQPQQPPPLQPPSAAFQQSGQTQNYRASTGAIPDGGKKKRFSAITGLFGKSNPAAELQGKFKLSREEKKAQKAQRHTSQPILQSKPTQQWPPLNPQFSASQQPTNDPTQGILPGQVAYPADPRFFSTQGAPQVHRPGAPGTHPQQGLPHPYPPSQILQDFPPQQQRLSSEGSAYLRTKQMAEEYRIRQAAGLPPRPVYEDPASVGAGPRQSSEQPIQPPRQPVQKPPPSNGYYYPEKPSPEPGAYVSSHEEQQRALYLRQQQQLEAERRFNAVLPHPSREEGAYNASVASRQQAQHHQRLPLEHSAYGASQIARQQALQQQQDQGFREDTNGATPEERQPLQHGQYLPGPEAFGRSQIHYDQIQHHSPPQRTTVPPQERQQPQQNQHQPGMTREDQIRLAEEDLARHRWQQQQMQLRQFHMQQQAQIAQQTANRSVSGPLLDQASPPASPVAQRHVSSPEPQYDTPPIPGAYGHVQGVFVSPRDQPHAYTTPHNQPGRQPSDAQMQPISPQVSAQSQMAPNTRHHSDASSVSVVSPISGPSPEPIETGPAADQRQQKPRMPSIPEVHQQASSQERPWHMNFPAGTTEQDIVRARQKQFLQQQFASQQQAQAERHAASPSPRGSPDKQSPPFSAPLPPPQEQGGGFREVLPRTSPQAFTAPHSAPLDRRSPQPTSSHVQGNAGWPLHARTDQGSPAQTAAGPQLPAQPHTPIARDHRPSYVNEPQHTAYDNHRHEPTPPNETPRVLPVAHQSQYDDDPPDDAPPSYDGPNMPHEGMEKSNPDRPRPPNIITAPNARGRQQDGRPRQASLGLMQHPQPASMAASPQRTAPDMGAESLRRQMLQQEEHAHMERIQRSQMQAAQRQREQQEREAARARAQELERGVSGGGRVGSLRSVSGSRTGGPPGWERRGLQGSNNRPIFELPALEDDEPVMRATSFPGQEWVPPMYVDD